MSLTVSTPEPDGYVRGWNAAAQLVGDLMVAIEDDAERGAVNAVYRRLVAEQPHRPEPLPGGGWMSGSSVGGPDGAQAPTWSPARQQLFDAVTTRARSHDERLLALAEHARADADPGDVVAVRKELVREHEREAAR